MWLAANFFEIFELEAKHQSKKKFQREPFLVLVSHAEELYGFYNRICFVTHDIT